MSNKYNINFRTLVKRRLPWRFRKPNLLYLIYAIIKPLQKLNSATISVDGFEGLNTFCLRIKEFLLYNGQTIYLERYLNQLYDPVNEGIYIVTTGGAFISYLFNKLELATKIYLTNKVESGTITYMYNKSETLIANFDFIVHVPNAVTYSENIMRKQIDQYKIAGKRYDIQIY